MKISFEKSLPNLKKITEKNREVAKMLQMTNFLLDWSFVVCINQVIEIKSAFAICIISFRFEFLQTDITNNSRISINLLSFNQIHVNFGQLFKHARSIQPSEG